MRTRFKVLSSVLAAAFTMSAFSVVVAAEPERELIDWGDGHFGWAYYSDNSLEIWDEFGTGTLSLDESLFPEGLLDNVNSVIFHIYDYEDVDEYSIENLSICDINCNVTDISFVGDGIKKISSLRIYDCHNDLESISFPEDTVLYSIQIDNCDFTTIDFFENIQSETLSVYDCNNLKELSVTGKYAEINELRNKNGFVISDYAGKASAYLYHGNYKTGLFANVYIYRCKSLTDISLSGEMNWVEVRSCPDLKALKLPSAISYQLQLNSLPGLTEISLPEGNYGTQLDGLGIESIIVPADSQSSIKYCDNLKKATLSSGITSTSSGMFRSCTQLSSVSLPKGLTTIEYYTFIGCSSLKSIDLPDTVKTINSYAFCRSGLESVTIPSGVTAIAYATFKECFDLKSVNLPATIKSINIEAFKGCSSLTDVYYSGTEAQWSKIAVSDGGTLGTVFGNAKIHFSESIKWGNDGNKWFCLDSSGERLKGWQQIDKNDKLSKDGSWYYFDNQGIMQTGWLKSGSSWYFMGSNGAMTTGWVEDGGKSYYMHAETGKMVANAWVESGGEYYYMSGSGAVSTGWVNADGAWYYMNASGKMVKDDWVQSGKSWYYMGSSGAMATGWLQAGSSWFYMGPSGAMVTGWQKIGSFWYYFSPAGYMATGWQKINGSWFFMHANGNMLTGWHLINGSWFYFDEDGYMQTGFKKIDGKTYYMDPNGYMRTGWIKLEGKMYFFDASGVMFTGTHVISGTSFEFAEDGHCINPPD